MSYDFDTIQSPCDHSQTRERYIVNSFDFRTLLYASNSSINMRAPIQSRSSVSVFIGGRLVSASHPVYGYSIVLDPNRLESSDIFYKIVFNKQVRLLIPLIEISYFTNVNFCLKCNGFGQVNDLKLANSGSLLHTFGTKKLVQKCLKFILTSICPFYPQYTCPIKGYVGRKFGVTVTDVDISHAILTSLQQVKQIQTAQATIPGQNLDPLERLKDITNVTALSDATNPTQVNVNAQVSSYGSNVTQPLGFTLTTTKTQYYSPGEN